MATEGKRKVAAKAMRAAADAPAPEMELQRALLPKVELAGRKAGRPKGALAKKTRDFLAYLEAMPNLELPGVWLAKRYSKTAAEICAEAGLSPLLPENLRWADDQRQDAAKALAPYVHERRPIGVSVEDKKVIELVVREAASDDAGGLAPLGPTAAAAIVLDVLGGEEVT